MSAWWGCTPNGVPAELLPPQKMKCIHSERAYQSPSQRHIWPPPCMPTLSICHCLRALQKMSNTPEELINRWGGDTFDHLMGLFYSRDAPRAGVFLAYSHHILSEPEAPPAWSGVVHNFGPMDPKHLARLPERYTHGFSYGNVMSVREGWGRFLGKGMGSSSLSCCFHRHH